MHKRKYRGFYDLGPVRVPPLPTRIVLTDRDDGKLWELIHDSTEGYVGLSDEISDKPDKRVYDAEFGPILPTEPKLQLIVRGGNLGYEVEVLPEWLSDRDQARILTRRGNSSTVFEIKVPSTGWDPDTLPGLVYEEI